MTDILAFTSQENGIAILLMLLGSIPGALAAGYTARSLDPVKSHTEWLDDVVAHCENNIEVKFPIIGDADRKVSTMFGMLDPGTSKDQDLPLTIRAVFIINPENKLMLSLNYP